QALATMGKNVAIIALLAGCLLPGAAVACLRVTPTPESLDQYQTIFVGTVTSIHLRGYENRLLGEPDAVDPVLGEITITDGSAPVDLRAVVTTPVRGNAAGAVELSLAGCTYDLPHLQDSGVFFVLPGGQAAAVIWESDKATYNSWLARLGVARDGR